MTTTNVIPIDRRLPRPGECLYCHLVRALETADCDHSKKLTERWIDVQARSARWVLRWAETQGGYCDCEIVMNVFDDGKRSVRHRKVRCAGSYERSTRDLTRCDGIPG